MEHRTRLAPGAFNAAGALTLSLASWLLAAGPAGAPPPIPLSMTDVQRAKAISVGNILSNPADIVRLDVDGDGRITLKDATMIHRYVLSM